MARCAAVVAPPRGVTSSPAEPISSVSIAVLLWSLNPLDWSSHTLDVLVSLGTVAAVIVALGIAIFGAARETHRERRSLPHLSLSHDHADDVRTETDDSGRPLVYVRVAVEAARHKRPAENVEVIVASIESDRPLVEWGGTDVIRNLGPLRWTHVDPPDLRIGPGSKRTIDLGYMWNDMFYVLLTAQPHTAVNVFSAGKYRFTLTLTGSNLEAVEWHITLSFEHRGKSAKPAEEFVRIDSGPTKS